MNGRFGLWPVSLLIAVFGVKVWRVGCCKRPFPNAKSQGVEIVEGYPVEPDKSYRFMGAPVVFDEVGFEEVGVAGNGRKIVRIHTSQVRALLHMKVSY